MFHWLNYYLELVSYMNAVKARSCTKQRNIWWDIMLLVLPCRLSHRYHGRSCDSIIHYPTKGIIISFNCWGDLVSNARSNLVCPLKSLLLPWSYLPPEHKYSRTFRYLPRAHGRRLLLSLRQNLAKDPHVHLWIQHQEPILPPGPSVVSTASECSVATAPPANGTSANRLHSIIFKSANARLLFWREREARRSRRRGWRGGRRRERREGGHSR